MTAAPPTLRMLWESADPADVLSERFGFADAGSAVCWLRDALWESWAIGVDDCERLVMSAGNVPAWVTSDGRRLIAKWSAFPSLFQRLADTAKLTMWLKDTGLPVAAPIPAKDGRLRAELDSVSLGVTPVIDGDLFDVGDPAQVSEAGHTLAALHEALAGYRHSIDGGRPTRGEQLVQDDFRSANLLHDGTRIPAALDFEEVAYRTRVADLAKAAVLLGIRHHGWEPASRLVRARFVDGCCHRAPLNGRRTLRTATRHLRGPQRVRLGMRTHRPPCSRHRHMIGDAIGQPCSAAGSSAGTAGGSAFRTGQLASIIRLRDSRSA